MEFEGVVFKVLAPLKGTSQRGEWVKQDVVFDQPGEYSRKVCVSFWGDKADDAAKFREGEKMAVSINAESREYNGRWFTELRAWKFNRAEVAAPAPSDFPPIEAPVSSYGADAIDDMPF